MSYRLSYFPIRGRGEQIRLMLHALEQPYEDVVVKRDQFLELKKEGPKHFAFGSMPMLEDGDLKLVQGPVILGYLARKHGVAPTELKAAARADAIALGAEDLRAKFYSLLGEGMEEKQAAFVSGDWQTRWLNAFEGLLHLNGDTGFFVGNSLTHADIAVWDVLDAITAKLKGATLDGHPGLLAHRQRIAALPALSAYLKSRA